MRSRLLGACVASVVIAAAALSAATSAIAAPSLSGAIGVGGCPTGVAVDSILHRAYAANACAAVLNVIDTQTNTVVDSVNGMCGPTAVAVDIQLHKVYVANPCAGGAASGEPGYISVLDGRTDALIDTVSFCCGGAPSALAVDSASHRVFVLNQGSADGINQDWVFDGTDDSVLGGIPPAAGIDPSTYSAAAVDPGSHALYLVQAEPSGSSVVVVDGINYTNPPIVLPLPAPDDLGASAVAVDESTHRVYVTNFSLGNGTSMVVIDGTTNTIASIVSGLAPAPGAVAVDPATGIVYVANAGVDGSGTTVTTVEGSTATVLGTTSVGGNPRGVAVDTTSHAAYATAGAALAIVREPLGTTVTIDASSAAPRFGESVVLNASVRSPAGVPSGSVVFADGSSVLGSVAVDGSGNASFSIAALAVGSHDIVASYGGDGTFSGSSASTSVVVDPAGTLISVAVSPDTVVFGESVVLNASVRSPAGVPSGSVVFADGSSVLGSVAVDGSGNASFSIAALAVGSHDIVASYGGDGTFSGSSASTSVVVDPAGTLISVAVSPDPLVYGGAAVLDASVASSGGVPSGSVVFADGSTVLGSVALDALGHASLTIGTFGAGPHSIAVSYGGDGSFGASSATFVLSVAKAATSSVVSVSPDPLVYGGAAVLKAWVASSGGVPSGSVVFADGSTVLGSVALDALGHASLTIGTFGAGPHSIAVSYGGDGSFGASSATFVLSVAKAATSSVVSVSPDPLVYRQAAVLKAWVASSGGVPSGSVVFADGSTVLGSVALGPLGHASLTIETFGAGPHSIAVSYGGDGSFRASSALTSVVVDRASTTTAVQPSPAASVTGQAVLIKASVRDVVGAIHSGTVRFKDGSTALGDVALDMAGHATLATTALNVGSHTITAAYLNNGWFFGSSDTQTYIVRRASANTTLASSVTSPVFGESITFTASVVVLDPGSGTPTGTVRFFDGTTLIGTSTIDSAGRASLSSSLSVGGHSILAGYGGDSSFSGALAALGTIVRRASDAVVLSSSVAPSAFGQPVTLAADIAATAPGAGSPTGTVRFIEGTRLLGSATVDGSGRSTFNIANLSVGTHAIVASYGGDGSFALANSPALSQIVGQATTTATLAFSPNPVVFGQWVTLTTTIAAAAPGSGIPTGTVQFSDGTTALGSAVVNGSGRATFATSLSARSHTIIARYTGDVSFVGSSASASFEVGKSTSSVLVTGSTPPFVAGQPVTVRAVISGAPTAGTPTGSVQFLDGTALLATIALDAAGTATFTTANLSVGAHTVTAKYLGDAAFTPGAGALAVVIGKANTTVTIRSLTNPAAVGQAVTFYASVATNTPGVGAPTGTVRFATGTTTLATIALDSWGHAALTTSTLPAGTRFIVASYAGDPKHFGGVVGWKEWIGLPGAPGSVSASPGNASASVSWKTPFSNGPPISAYVLTTYVAGVAQFPRVYSSTATTEVVTGLTNGQMYAFSISARNANGTGIPSPLTSGVIVGAPTAPTAVSATSKVGAATLRWTAPLTANGSPITSYIVTAYIAGQVQFTRTYLSSSTTQAVIFLKPRTSYTFAVAAINTRGTGPPSQMSNTVVPT